LLNTLRRFTPGDPVATRDAVLQLVDTPNPPLHSPAGRGTTVTCELPALASATPPDVGTGE
jgi:hypothetical protein